MENPTTKIHAALLASPGIGHLVPVLELGKRLVTQLDFKVTIFVVGAEASVLDSQLQSLPNPNIFNVVSLPPVDISGLVEPNTSIVTKIIVIMRESLPSLRSEISVLKLRPTVLIVDLFGTEALALADELNMLKYVLIASNAWFLATTIYFPTVDGKHGDEHIFQKKPLMVPGCKSVRFEDTLDAFLDKNDELYVEYLRIGREILMADGILVNTWEDLEAETLESMRDTKMLGQVTRVPIYPIGPLVREMKSPGLENPVLNWLDKQPAESVIYVSFGSGGTLPAKQITELAWGLELSEQRFIWVIRPPVENDATAAYFSVGKASDGTPNYLPDGFLTRNSKLGLVIPDWAPQGEILRHPSVGGIISHCGWNSTTESIVNGVPMIAWPLYAEQKMNATMLTEDIGVAIRSKKLPSESIVERKEIEMLVRSIMVDKEGNKTRSRVKELKSSAEKALSRGGSSYNSLLRVAEDCEKSLQGLEAMAHGA